MTLAQPSVSVRNWNLSGMFALLLIAMRSTWIEWMPGLMSVIGCSAFTFIYIGYLGGVAILIVTAVASWVIQKISKFLFVGDPFSAGAYPVCNAGLCLVWMLVVLSLLLRMDTNLFSSFM